MPQSLLEKYESHYQNTCPNTTYMYITHSMYIHNTRHTHTHRQNVSYKPFCFQKFIQTHTHKDIQTYTRGSVSTSMHVLLFACQLGCSLLPVATRSWYVLKLAATFFKSHVVIAAPESKQCCVHILPEITKVCLPSPLFMMISNFCYIP